MFKGYRLGSLGFELGFQKVQARVWLDLGFKVSVLGLGSRLGIWELGFSNWVIGIGLLVV